MNKRHTLLSALALVTALLVAGCGSSSDGSSSSKSPSPSATASASSAPNGSASPHAASVVITIKNFKFTVPSSVKAGAMVMVKNEDSEAHTVTADGKGGFDVKVDPGATAMLTAPKEAGSFPFHCTYHSDMHGTLKVS
jgi:plastocyanin